MSQKTKNKKFLFNKKAEGDILGIPLGELIGIVLAGLIIVTTIFIVLKFVKGPNLQKEQATINNFNELAKTIEEIKGDIEIEHPVYIKYGYTIFGFEKSKDIIKGTCKSKIWSIDITTAKGEVKKPKEQCGENGCLCLCKQNWKKLFKQDCEESICMPFDDISISGGVYNDGSGSCDFALVSGRDEGVRILHIKKEGDIVHVCSKPCS